MHYKSATGEEKREIDKVVAEVEDFVEWIMQHHVKRKIRSGKVIHDGVWGTNRYEAYEIALINTPIIQRLRQIHQTAYTFLTYPSTQHTRFEHTLGVTAQVGNLFHALENKFKHSFPDKKELLSEGLLRTLRTSAIMHDCGHGPLSHTSEEIYGAFPEMRLLKKFEPFKSAGPGEIFSYLILDSSKFKEIFRAIKDDYSVDIEDDLMKNAIVGHTTEPESEYKVDILNGPFDADKLDYLFRDGHFSGLPLQIDLDRLWYSVDINTVETRRRLTIDWGGTSSLEQILFSKMTLFPAVYQHHKVRTCDCMFKGIIEYIKEKNMAIRKIMNHRREELSITLGRAIHFLYLTDGDIFNMPDLLAQDAGLHILVHNLFYRRLLKRAVVISRDTVEDEESLDEYIKYRDTILIREGHEYYRWLAKRIWEKAGRPGLRQELWVDCPKDPSFGEESDTWISPLSSDQQPMRLSDFFKTDQYANQYKHKKWRSHVFCRPEDVDKVASACVDIYKEEFGIIFKPLAFALCRIPIPPVVPVTQRTQGAV